MNSIEYKFYFRKKNTSELGRNFIQNNMRVLNGINIVFSLGTHAGNKYMFRKY